MTRDARIETDECHVWLRDDGILHVEWQPGAVETLTASRAVLSACHTLSAGQPRPALADIRGVKSETRESRDYWAAKDRSADFTAAALLVESGISRVLGNFFLGVAKPGYPTKLFTSESAAIEWLKGHLL